MPISMKVLCTLPLSFEGTAKNNRNWIINGKVHQSQHTGNIAFSPDKLLQENELLHESSVS